MKRIWIKAIFSKSDNLSPSWVWYDYNNNKKPCNFCRKTKNSHAEYNISNYNYVANFCTKCWNSKGFNIKYIIKIGYISSIDKLSDKFKELAFKAKMEL